MLDELNLGLNGLAGHRPHLETCIQSWFDCVVMCGYCTGLRPLMSSFRALLLIEGITQQGPGNWQAVAEDIGTCIREVEEQNNIVYIDLPNWPRLVCQSFSLFIFYY